MTREELLTKLARNRATKLALTWGQLTNAIQSSSAQTKADMLQAVNSNNDKYIAAIFGRMVKNTKADLARAEVDALAADNSITIDELITLLG